jgi:hypothetical protein
VGRPADFARRAMASRMTDEISSFAGPQATVPTLVPSRKALGVFARPLRALRLSPTLLGGFAVLALWFLRRPYLGPWHDARIYMGKGLADLDPQGVGADLFFRFDAQSSFSVFSKIVDALIGLLGYGHAALLLTALALALWLAALGGLVARLARGRLYWATLIVVAASRGSYGAFEILHYAESFPTPRPFAEAAVLWALSALLAGSWARASLLLLLAGAFHPLMALAGAGTVYVYLCLQDRRWLFLAVAAVACALVAALAGAPLFAQLLERYDRSWLIVLRLRSTYLFPSMWNEAAFAPIFVEAATLGFAATAASTPVKRLFLSALIASLGGLALSYGLGDALPLVLIVQAQLWRGLWLLALFGVLAMCLCVPRLWMQGPAGRAALALFAAAWISPESRESALLCVGAIALFQFRDLLSLRAARVFGHACLGVAALFIAAALGVDAFVALKTWREAPETGFDVAQVFSAGAFVPTLIALAALVLAVSDRRPPRRLSIGATALLALLAAFGWRSGAPFDRALAENRHPPELERMLAAHPGDVLWIGENEAPWVWLGRANWASYLQGGGAVFSRPLALVWRDRMLALLENDWIEPALFEPWRRRGAVEKALPEFTREKIERICARPDAPAWILGAVKSPRDVPADVAAKFWRAPAKYVARRDESGAKPWDKVEDVAAIDCAPYRGASGGDGGA